MGGTGPGSPGGHSFNPYGYPAFGCCERCVDAPARGEVMSGDWQVGDWAVDQGGSKGKIVAISGKDGWVRYVNGEHATWALADLARPKPRTVTVREWKHKGVTCWTDKPPLGADETGRTHTFEVDE